MNKFKFETTSTSAKSQTIPTISRKNSTSNRRRNLPRPDPDAEFTFGRVLNFSRVWNFNTAGECTRCIWWLIYSPGCGTDLAYWGSYCIFHAVIELGELDVRFCESVLVCGFWSAAKYRLMGNFVLLDCARCVGEVDDLRNAIVYGNICINIGWPVSNFPSFKMATLFLKMDHFIKYECIVIVKINYKYSKSFAKTFRVVGFLNSMFYLMNPPLED